MITLKFGQDWVNNKQCIVVVVAINVVVVIVAVIVFDVVVNNRLCTLIT